MWSFYIPFYGRSYLLYYCWYLVKIKDPSFRGMSKLHNNNTYIIYICNISISVSSSVYSKGDYCKEKIEGAFSSIR